MLIVSCDEPAHQKIEVMLSKIAAMNKANLEKNSAEGMPGGGLGSQMGGGGMGGMGGGMGGGGGGFF